MSKTNVSNSRALTKPQRQLLAEAGRRADCGLLPPNRTDGEAADANIEVLLGQKLVREIRAKADLPVWRQDGEGRCYSLVLTRAGRQIAVGSAARAPRTEPKEISSPVMAETLAAATPRNGSKLGTVVTMLRRDRGTSLSELMAVTGWLPHTTRAALTGLRKRGYPLSRQAAQDGSGSVYRIVETSVTA